MADNEGALKVIREFKDSETNWSVAYSKDKNEVNLLPSICLAKCLQRSQTERKVPEEA